MAVIRTQELVAIKAVRQQDNDDAAAALQQPEADVLSAQVALKSGRINLNFTRTPHRSAVASAGHP